MRAYCNPICVQCGRVTKCQKNGVVIAYPGHRAAFLNGDRFGCEPCGTSFVVVTPGPKKCGFRMSDEAYNRKIEVALDPIAGLVVQDDGWGPEWSPKPVVIEPDGSAEALGA